MTGRHAPSIAAASNDKVLIIAFNFPKQRRMPLNEANYGQAGICSTEYTFPTRSTWREVADSVIQTATADGRLFVASADENADLFWAIRGGGNFGLCTSLEYKLQPVHNVYWWPMFFEIEETKNILEFYRDYIKEAPEEMGAFPKFQIAPPLPFIPEDRHGDIFAAIVACWSGYPADGERQFKAFHDVAEVKAEHVGPVPYPAINAAFDGLFPTGIRQYWKGIFVKELTDEAIAAHVEHGPILSAQKCDFGIRCGRCL